jgi:GYF domain 2
MSNRSWFFASEDKQQGPYPEDQFRDFIARGLVRADTLVWSEGMAGWQRAGDIPGLIPGGSGPPAFLPTDPYSTGGPLWVDVGVWELFWRSLLLWIGLVFIIPIPWAMVMYCRWFVSRLHVPQRPNLTFTGRPMDLWWFLVAAVVLICLALTGIRYLGLLAILAQVFLYWLVIKWFVANISSEGRPLSLAFRGSFWAYLGWSVLSFFSTITIIGWAWVATAWKRWMCRNIAGTRRAVVFNASGWQILWRTLVLSLVCGLIIPIPWMLAWYVRWYVSQFALADRTAYANA